MGRQKLRIVSNAGLTLFLTISLAIATITAPASAQDYKFKVLHTFHGKDGGGPEVALTRDSEGNLYGDTVVGGTGKCPPDDGCGTVFKLNKAGQQVWLYSLDGKDGQGVVSSLLLEPKGTLLGTAGYGGNPYCKPNGCGVAFTLDSTGKRETVLHKFDYTDGMNPLGPLAIDAAGNIYGATAFAGVGDGLVYELNSAGYETVLYAFSGGSDGYLPAGGVIRDAEGNLYGTTQYGGVGFGDNGFGVVFMVDTAGNETVLHEFGAGSDGAYPVSALIFDHGGNLYGATEAGGSSACGGTGCGAVFKLSPNGNGTWNESVLYAFCSTGNCADGERPLLGPLSIDSAGNIYGTAVFGGTADNGVVFKLDTSNHETVLYSFTGGIDGASPWAGVIIDRQGNLYGTTHEGGATCFVKYTCGVVFELSP